MKIRSMGIGILLGLMACGTEQTPTVQPRPQIPVATALSSAAPTPIPTTLSPTATAPPSVRPSAAAMTPPPAVLPSPSVSPTPSASLAPERTNTMGMKFVLVQPGTFMMGSLESETGRDNDETRHMVTITKPFYIQTTEVTQKEWLTIMGANPAFFQIPPDTSRPVEQVSWNDIQGFISKLQARDKESGSYRLPTEAQWELAARSGTEGLFVFGSNAAFLGNYAWFSGNNTPNGTKAIKQKLPTTLGLYDIHGNVAELVEDNYLAFSTDAAIDPNVSVSTPFKVVRGGSWQSGAEECRLANREIQRPDLKTSNNVGFRLVWVP